MHEHTLSSLLLLLQVCPAVLKHPCAYICTIYLVRILHVHMGAAWGPQNVRDIHTQVQIPDSTTVTLSLAPRCLQNLGTRLLLASPRTAVQWIGRCQPTHVGADSAGNCSNSSLSIYSQLGGCPVHIRNCPVHTHAKTMTHYSSWPPKTDLSDSIV